jgi:hypothetical protein
MFDRFARSWALAKASASVLQSDKELLLFPVISSIATLLVTATFIIPLFAMGVFEGGGRMGPGSFILGYVFYVCQYFVIFFFNTALVGAAMIRLEGGDPTVADGLAIAKSKIGAILGYAAIAATVGIILRAIEERAGFIGQIVVAMIGTAWTIATALVVPVLVAQDVGPVEAVKESVVLLKKTWGENIIGAGGIGLVFGLIIFSTMVVGAIVSIAATAISGWLALGLGILTIVAVLVLGVVQAALAGIYSAALYRYAVDGQAPVGFQTDALQLAFKPKK